MNSKMTYKKRLGFRISYHQLRDLISEKIERIDLREGEILTVINDPIRDCITIKMEHPDGIEVPEEGEFPIRRLEA